MIGPYRQVIADTHPLKGKELYEGYLKDWVANLCYSPMILILSRS
jgi:hypothetical protein